MKILLLNDKIPPEGKGGAEAVVWRLAQGLAAAGQETRVVATTDGDSFEEIRDGIPTYHIHAGYPERFRAWLSLWNPQTVRAFRQLLARIQPDVVNAHNIHYLLSYHALKIARDAGCAVAHSAHDAMPFVYGKLPAPGPMGNSRLPGWYNLRQNRFRYNPLRNIMIKRALERQAHIRVVPSQALAEAFADNDMPPVEVVHNGIDLADWQPVDEARVAELRQRLDLADKRVLLMAGRLTREKGMNTILRALDDLGGFTPDARLLLLSARDIEAQIREEFAHLRPRICVGGWLSGEELRAAYQMADVVAVPSNYVDPFPTVNLEAMAMGKPVVATRFGGSAEIVVDGETGFIVDPFDRAAFADRLRRLLNDEGLRREMGWRGRERIRRKFQLKRQVQQMVDIYRRAIECRGD